MNLQIVTNEESVYFDSNNENILNHSFLQKREPIPKESDILWGGYNYSIPPQSTSHDPVQLSYMFSQRRQQDAGLIQKQNLDINNVESFTQLDKSKIDSSTSAVITQPMVNYAELGMKIDENILTQIDLIENPYSEFIRTDYLHKSSPTLLDGIHEDSRIMAIQENNMYMAITLCITTISISFLLLR